MPQTRPYVLSIAGFDPTGGAGVMADIKTFEAHKVIGLGVTTSITYQTEDSFSNVEWLTQQRINEQITLLMNRYPVEYVKIGLVESPTSLGFTIATLKKLKKNVKIIWDPVLETSTGFSFHTDLTKDVLQSVCKEIFMFIPNWEEMKKLGGKEPLEGAKEVSKYCKIYLKGGHNEENVGKDYLFTEDKTYPFRKKQEVKFHKHGSGCVLSSAITANLARGFPLVKACLRSKNYITRFLNSNNTLLGYHKI